MNLIRSSIKLFAANTGGAVIQFVGIIHFSKVLGAADMGLFFLFQAVLGVATIPADFGLRAALEKRLTEGEHQGEYLTSAIVLKLIFVTIVSLFIFLASNFITQYLGADLVIYIVTGLYLQEIAHVLMSNLKGELRVGETAELNLAQQFVWLLSGSILVQLGYGPIALIYGYILGFVSVIVWGFIKSNTEFKSPSLYHSKSLFDFGKYNVIASIGGLFFSWIDILIIGVFLTNAHVGAYEVAWRITGVVLLLSRSIGTALFPQISSWDSEMSYDKIEDALSESIIPSVLLIFPAFFGVIVFGEEILSIVFGSEFVLAQTALIILMGGKLVHAAFILLNRGLQGIGHVDSAAYATVISVISNVVLNLILIQAFGLAGAAAATTTAFLVNSVVHYLYLYPYIDIRLPVNNLAWCIISSLFMGILLYTISEFVIVDSVINLAVVVSLGAVIYFTSILLFRPFRLKIITVIDGL